MNKKIHQHLLAGNSLKKSSSLNQLGFTLVELMVAIVLGLLLTAAVLQTYLSTKQTYRVTEGVSRVQENARFALHFLTKDLRNAGYSGCIGRVRNKLNGDPTEYISFESAVIGWDYDDTTATNTATNDFSLSATNAALDLPTDVNKWGRTNSAGGTSPLPAILQGEVARGSDVLWFKNFEELDIIIKEHNDKSVSIVAESEHGVPNDSIMLVGNCSEVELFQHLSQGQGKQVNLNANTGAGGSPGNRAIGGSLAEWSRLYTAEDNLYGFVQTYYYIGEGASGLPSLFRFRTGKPSITVTSTDVTGTAEELVEGVESMQVVFGEDLNNDDNPNRYISASEVTNWDDIVSVRVGLLYRTPNNSTDQDQSTSYTLLDNINFTHDANDNLLRYVTNTTVKLRNRGLDENLAYYICDAPTDKQSGTNGTDKDGNGVVDCT